MHFKIKEESERHKALLLGLCVAGLAFFTLPVLAEDLIEDLDVQEEIVAVDGIAPLDEQGMVIVDGNTPLDDENAVLIVDYAELLTDEEGVVASDETVSLYKDEFVSVIEGSQVRDEEAVAIIDEIALQNKSLEHQDSESLLNSLGPVISTEAPELNQGFPTVNTSDSTPLSVPYFEQSAPWVPALVPFLDTLPEQDKDSEREEAKESHSNIPIRKRQLSKIMAVDVHPKIPQIAILIDDLGYSRRGMMASLALPKEVALAILPGTPFAKQTALAAQDQQRMTLLHAPMENQRALELGPGGLYAQMTEDELKETLVQGLEGVPGVQGVNNHMGSLLTTKAMPMKWVMEVLQDRSLFFIDSLTSSESVAEKTAQDHGLKTVSRDVFLDNIRTDKAIDRQFSRLLKLARLHGSVLAIGHPYPETMAYLKKRLENISDEGVRLVSLSDVLRASKIDSFQ